MGAPATPNRFPHHQQLSAPRPSGTAHVGRSPRPQAPPPAQPPQPAQSLKGHEGEGRGRVHLRVRSGKDTGPRPSVQCAATAALSLPVQTAWRRAQRRAVPGEAGGQQSRTLPGSLPATLTPAKLLRLPRHNFRRAGGGSGDARRAGRCRAWPPARRAGRYQGDHFLTALHCFAARRRRAARLFTLPCARSCASASPARGSRTGQLTGPDEEVELVRGPLMHGRRHVYAAGAASH